MNLAQFYKKLFIKAQGKEAPLPDKTVRRIEEVISFFTQGYQVKDIANQARQSLFDCPKAESQQVVIKGISFVSLCEHHLLPMFGTCHIAYLPSEKVLGLGRITEIVETFSRRLQLQEKLTSEIATTIHTVTAARGVAVRMEAQHFCAVLTGIEKIDQTLVTTAFLGDLQGNKLDLFGRS